MDEFLNSYAEWQNPENILFHLYKFLEDANSFMVRSMVACRQGLVVREGWRESLNDAQENPWE